MRAAVLALSHSPLLHLAAQHPPAPVREELAAALDRARGFVRELDPTLVVSFAPDHYNGFFYDLMPPACIGYQAVSIGDYDSQEGPLDVPAGAAAALAEHCMAGGVDVAISRRMEVDHGAVQPLELLFGDIAARPVIPVFVNGVARPLVPMRRVRALGEAVGSWLTGLPAAARVLLIASGGLSHDPPVPQWEQADENARALLLAGRHPTPQARAARQQRVIDGGLALARGEATFRDLNPDWDNAFLDVCAGGDTRRFDGYEAAQMAVDAGNSSHEVRSWVAAFSALAATGGYRVTQRFYRPIPEYIAGFGLLTALGGPA